MIFFFIHLSDLEENWNLFIRMFDSIPNAQHENLNKAKPKNKMSWQWKLFFFFILILKKSSKQLLRTYYTNGNRPHPLPKNYNFTLSKDLLLTLVARRNFKNRSLFHIKKKTKFITLNKQRDSRMCINTRYNPITVYLHLYYPPHINRMHL